MGAASSRWGTFPIVGSLDARMHMSGLKLHGLDLSGLDLSNSILDGSDLSGCDLRDAKLCRASLRKCSLQGAKLNGTDLRGAVLGDSDLSSCNMRHANLQHIYIEKCKINSADLDGADLTGARLRAVVFHNTSFVDTKLLSAHFVDCEIQQCDFMSAELQFTSFYGSSLRDCALDGSTAKDCTLPESGEQHVQNASLRPGTVHVYTSPWVPGAATFIRSEAPRGRFAWCGCWSSTCPATSFVSLFCEEQEAANPGLKRGYDHNLHPCEISRQQGAFAGGFLIPDSNKQ